MIVVGILFLEEMKIILGDFVDFDDFIDLIQNDELRRLPACQCGVLECITLCACLWIVCLSVLFQRRDFELE
jgi:hypothetical protein